MLDISVFVVLSYDGDYVVQRICMDFTVDGLKNQVYNKLSVFTPWSIAISYNEEFKRSVIETNSDLQSLTAFCWAKKRVAIEICVRLVKTSGIVNASSDASNSLIDYCDDLSELSRTVLKSITWSDWFREVGQTLKVELLNLGRSLSCTTLRLVTNINLCRMIRV